MMDCFIPSNDQLLKAKKVKRNCFKNIIKCAKEIYFLQEKGYSLGITAMELPVTVISFLRSAPNINKIHIFTAFPQSFRKEHRKKHVKY